MSKWKKIVFPDKKDLANYNVLDILTETENVQNDNESLLPVYRGKRKNYRKTIEDLLYVKSHFCANCIGEEFNIDYRSINMDEPEPFPDADPDVEKEQEATILKTYKSSSSLLDESKIIYINLFKTLGLILEKTTLIDLIVNL